MFVFTATPYNVLLLRNKCLNVTVFIVLMGVTHVLIYLCTSSPSMDGGSGSLSPSYLICVSFIVYLKISISCFVDMLTFFSLTCRSPLSVHSLPARGWRWWWLSLCSPLTVRPDLQKKFLRSYRILQLLQYSLRNPF